MNQQKQHNPSGHGKGRWHDTETLIKSRKKRDKKNKAQKEARKRNR